jgi:hypothetical protein
MDRLPKKEAIQKTKKTKVEKSKPHTLDPLGYYQSHMFMQRWDNLHSKVYIG